MHACTMCRVVRGRLCGVSPFIFTWNPGLNSGHQVCDRCFTCWVILIDSPVFHCLINISILFHPPPTSLFLCVCMHVFACTCVWCEEPSPVCCCFILWVGASVKYRPWHYSQPTCSGDSISAFPDHHTHLAFTWFWGSEIWPFFMLTGQAHFPSSAFCG